MVKWLLPLLLLVMAYPSVSQEIDLSGSWDAYLANELSRYSIKEHRSTETVVGPKDMVLSTDGTVSTDIPNLNALKWQIDEGFLLFETTEGNFFYYPRPVGTNMYFLVRVDVLERNEDLVSITSKPQGNLVIIKK